MRPLQEQDFDKMAARVVDNFMGGAKLADAATQEAMGGGLNPDQIERLVQSANTMAFLRLMEQQKEHAAGAGGAPDMTHEFDPIDTRQVMQQIVGNVDVPHMDAPPPADPGMGDHGPLPDEMAPPDAGGDAAAPAIDDDNDGPFPKGSKDKGPKKDKKPAAAAAKKDEAKEAAFRTRRQRKLADVLEDQFKQAEWAFEDGFKELEGHLKQAWGGPSWDVFEKNALALHGDEVGATVLNQVRTAHRLPPLAFADICAKHAALVDRHIVDDGPAIQVFERLVKIAAEAAKLQRGAEWLRSQCS